MVAKNKGGIIRCEFSLQGPSLSLDGNTSAKQEEGALPQDVKPRELMNSRSGLESLQSMEDALPIAAS